MLSHLKKTSNSLVSIGETMGVVNPSEKIKILRIIARMNVGGPALQIVGISTHLDTNSFRQKLLTGYCEENEIDLLFSKQTEIDRVRIPGLGRSIGFSKDIISFIHIRRIMKIYSPHIVHTHTAKAGFIGRLASLSLFAKHKRIHTFHGHLLYGYFSPFKTTLMIAVEKFLARFTHILISVGSKVRDELIESGIGDEEKFRIVNPGLEIDSLLERDEACKKLGVDPAHVYFGWIGRIVDIKKPFRILEIAEQLKVLGSKAHILVAGDGEVRSELERISQEKKLNIHFLGWQLNIELVLSACDGVILTSDNEGTPLSLIQASMAKLPSIATNVGSVPEIVLDQETGYVRKYNSKEFAALIDSLVLNPELRKSMGLAGAKRAVEKFSVERLTRDHEAIYREITETAIA